MKRLTTAGTRNKSMLLPMPRTVRDALSVEYHLMLEALHGGYGDGRMLSTLAQVLLVSYFLHQSGYQDGSPVFDSMEAVIESACRRGNETGIWRVDTDGYQLLGRLLTLHDRQLAVAPLCFVAQANAHLQHTMQNNPPSDRHAEATDETVVS
jgi:hypothetical protein